MLKVFLKPATACLAEFGDKQQQISRGANFHLLYLPTIYR